MAENFSKLMTNTKLPVLKAQGTHNKINTKQKHNKK